MKRVPQYRHSGRPGKLSGMRERAVWLITKRGGQATGTELAAMLGITLIEFNRVARTLTRGGGLVANIVASPTWITDILFARLVRASFCLENIDGRRNFHQR